MFYNTLTHPRRDQHGRNTNTETTEIKSGVLSISSLLSVSQFIASRNVSRRDDVIAKTATFVKGEDEQGLMPLRGASQSLIDTLDEVLTEGDRRRRMHRIEGAAFGVNVCELGKVSTLSIFVELRDTLNVGVNGATGPSPVVKKRVRVETTDGTSIELLRSSVTFTIVSGVRVVDPGDIFLGQLLEDRLLSKTAIVETGIVATVTLTGT
jgi:hypothetical protein